MTMIDFTSPDTEPAALPNQALVGSTSDLPAPAGGVITLVADTEYFFTDDVSIGTDRIKLSGNVVRALDSSLANLTYTGTGNMFTAVGTNDKITRITTTCANGNLLNIDGDNTGIFQLFDMTLGTVKNVGTLTDLPGSQITNVSFGNVTTDGILFTGTHGKFLASGNIMNLAAGTLFDLGTATFDGFTFTSSLPDIASGATMISGAAASANLNTGGFGTLQDIIMTGAGTAISGISEDDAKWQFVINSTISDTRPSAMISFNTPTDTTISTASTPVLIAGTWTEEEKSQFTTTAAGRITYIGVKDITVAVSIATSIEAVSGSNKDITVYLALNGTEISNSGSPNRVSANDPKNTSVMWELDLVTDDFVEIFIENTTDTVNLTVNKASMRVD